MKTIATVPVKTATMAELRTCPLCKSGLEHVIFTRKSVKLNGFKCKKCGEVVFPSSEIFRYEILTGKRNVREIRKVGNSIVIGVPSELAHKMGIKPGDLAHFDKKDHELAINILKK